MNPDETQCLGCVYLMAPTSKMYDDVEVTPVDGAPWSDVDATVFFWVRASRIAESMDATLLAELRSWLRAEWPFTGHVFVTNEQFIQQVDMIEATDLALRFEFRRPSDPGLYRCYA